MNWWNILPGGDVSLLLFRSPCRLCQNRSARPEAPKLFTKTSIDRNKSPAEVPSRTRRVKPLKTVMQRFARASQFTRGGSSPSVTYCTSRPRMCFVSARRFSTRNSCRSVSSTGTIRVLEVKRQPQYRGECRRSRTFSSSIARTASLPVGNTRKVSCASASVSAQDRIAVRRMSSLVPKLVKYGVALARSIP